MKKNGFTLVELLGVIILLGVLSVIVVPVVRDSIKQSKRKAYDKQVNTIIMTAKEWSAENTDALDDNSFLVRVETLKKTGLLENKEIINPVNNEEMKGCAKVSYNQEFNQYEYEYLDSCIGYNDILSSDDECLEGEPNNCNPGTPVKVQVNDNESYNFYVIADDGKELTMIMDRNLYNDENIKNSDVNIEWISANDYLNNYSNIDCNFMACNERGPLTALRVLKERTSNWKNIGERSFIINDDGFGNNYNSFSMTSRARLLTYKEATSSELGCTIDDSSCKNYLCENIGDNGDNHTWGYWLADSRTGQDGALDIRGACKISYNSVYSSGNSGVRPVITVPKFAPIY